MSSPAKKPSPPSIRAPFCPPITRASTPPSPPPLDPLSPITLRSPDDRTILQSPKAPTGFVSKTENAPKVPNAPPNSPNTTERTAAGKAPVRYTSPYIYDEEAEKERSEGVEEKPQDGEQARPTRTFDGARRGTVSYHGANENKENEGS
ncbi:hypothetical protein MMC22_010736 [Lobaria immixta]|nr:hypothetical protein [Lobaria immixta]